MQQQNLRLNMCILSAGICDNSSAPLLIGVYPADQAPWGLREEFGVLMCLQLGFADEKAVAAVAVVCGSRRVAMAEDCFNRDGVNAIGGNDEVSRHYCSVREGYGWSNWVLLSCQCVRGHKGDD
jgi:hypothetical protein